MYNIVVIDDENADDSYQELLIIKIRLLVVSKYNNIGRAINNYFIKELSI